MGVKRILITGSLALAALAGAGGALAAPPRDHLRSFQCQRALEPAARAISVTSVMRPVSRTQTMAVRFDLLSRAKGAVSFTTVTGSDLGSWISPSDRTLGRRPGDVWILKKPVVDLPAPAAYRFRVSFRWTGAHHRVLVNAVKTTGTCLEPELRPDLAIHRIGRPKSNLKDTADFYAVTVVNYGATAAGPFPVELAAPDGSTASEVQINRLAAHAATQVTLRGPLCSAGAPLVTVDPPDALGDYPVDDPNRQNNVATASCTAATTPFRASRRVR